MQAQSGRADYRALQGDTEQAVRISRQVLKEPEEQIMRVNVLNMHLEACSQLGDTAKSLAAIEELVQIYRPISESTAEERKGQPDGNLIEYLYNYSALLETADRLQESVDIHKESKKLIGAITELNEQTTHLKANIEARDQSMTAIEHVLKQKKLSKSADPGVITT